MNYKHTRRSGILFVLLSVLTLSVYSLVVVSKIAKEVHSLGGKKRAPYFVAWLLGWITLGIVPLCYFSSLSREVGDLAVKCGVPGKTSYGTMFNWNLFGCLILIGPFIAWCKFLRVLNRLEALANDGLAAPAESSPEDASASVEESSPEASGEAEEAEQEQSESAEASPEEKPEPRADSVAEERPEPIPAEGARWRVRYGKKPSEVAVFASREAAIAFARGLALGRGGNSKIKVRGRGE